MSTTTVSHPSFPLFTQLVRRLRQTNARYNQIAYQCRHTQRLTYHAKRRAYRVGLHINTSKARAAGPDVHIAVDRTAGSPVWVATETETEEDDSDSESGTEGACLPNPWPRTTTSGKLLSSKQPATQSLSPLGLGLSNFDDVDTCDLPFRGPVPGAPRWKPKPLPEDECGMNLKEMTNESVCTHDPVWRGVIATPVSMPVGGRPGWFWLLLTRAPSSTAFVSQFHSVI